MVIALGEWSLKVPVWMLLGGAFLLALWITWLSIPSIIRVAVARGLYDRPNPRSSHNRNIPTLGGMALFAGFAVAASLFAGLFVSRELLFLIAGLIILYYIGIKDDILVIDPYKKLIGQLFASMVAVVGGDIRITDMYGLFGIDHLGYVPGVLLTVLMLMVFINGYNFIDGVDGLAGGSALLASLAFGGWFLAHGFGAYAVIAAALAGALLGFLRYNVPDGRNKIFLGDTGSLLLGLIVGVLAVRFMEYEHLLLSGRHTGTTAVLAMALLILPLADVVRTVMRRLIRGIPLSTPEKKHIHHIFINKGFSHRTTTIILLSINALLALFVYFLRHLNGNLLLSIFVAVVAVLLVMLSLWNRKEKKETRHVHDAGFSLSGHAH